MKNIRRILLLILFVFVCPAFVFGCGELKFDDVPYAETEITGEQVVTLIDEARTYMIQSLELKTKIETVNTYNFYKTQDKNFERGTIKDVITTTLGNAKSNPAVTTVETVRYREDQKVFRELKTYVRETLSNNAGYKSFCYTLREEFGENGQKVSTTQNRSEYDSAYLDFSRLFNNVVIVAKVEEVDTVSTKVFENTTYYKLETYFDGYEAVFDRFEKNENLKFQKDVVCEPELFTCLEPTRDSAMPFTYQFGINASGYLSYSKLSYSVVNDNHERYMSVSSESKVTGFGSSVETLNEPANVNDYTVETFMRSMQQQKSYIVYKSDIVDTSYTKTTVIKMENISVEEEEGEGENSTTEVEKNFDYSVKVERYNSGVSTLTEYYYVKYDKDLSEYKTYKLDLALKKYVEDSTYFLGLLNFNFDLDVEGVTISETGVYTYGTSASYIKVGVAEKEVSTITTLVASEDTVLNVESFGNDTTDLHMVESLNGFTPGQPAGEGN